MPESTAQLVAPNGHVAKEIGIAFVGAGTVTSGPHSRAVERCDAARLVGVFDPDPPAAQTLAARHDARTYDSLDDLLSDADVQAVVVAAPTTHQFASAKACLKAGRHVLIEKPIGETVEQIDELTELAQRQGLVAMPAHNFIQQATLAKAKRAVEDGRFGILGSAWLMYNVAFPEQDAARYVGALRQIGWHLSYSLLYLLGRPRRVMAAATCLHYERLDREDQVMLVCEMPGGALANLWGSFVASDLTSDPWTVVYKLLGTKGSFVFSWNEAVFDDPGGPAWGVPAYMDGFAAEVDFFVRHAVLGNEEPISTMRDARDVMRITEAAERSLAADGAFQTVDYSGDWRS